VLMILISVLLSIVVWFSEDLCPGREPSRRKSRCQKLLMVVLGCVGLEAGRQRQAVRAEENFAAAKAGAAARPPA